jgi:DNA-binding CsgD family transcriptional regulator
MEDSGHVLDLIYEAAMVADLWPRVLETIATDLGSIGGLLFTGDGEEWTCSAPVHDTFQRIVEDGWLARNTRLSRSLAAGLAYRVVTDFDIFTEADMDADPLYQALRPLGWGWFAGAATSLPSSRTAVFSFERAYAAGPYSQADARRLEMLRPHLARGTLLANSIGLDRHATMAETLARVGLPAAVLGQGGKLLASNPLFEDLTPALIVPGADRVRLPDAGVDAQLAAALHALRLGLTGAVPLSFALKSRSGQPARLLHLLPMRRTARDMFTGAACLAVVTPGRTRPSPDLTLVCQLFELSPREAMLASALGRGETLSAYATRSGISINTARTQIGRVFEKTGLRRQSDVAVLFNQLSGF